MNVLVSWALTTFDWTWKTSAFAGVLIALVFLAQSLLGRRLTARLRYMLSLLILFRLLLPFAPASSLSLENLLPSDPVEPVSAPSTNSAQPDDSAHFKSSLPSRGGSLSATAAFCAIWVAGCCCFIALAVWRYRKWGHWITDAATVNDPKFLAMFDSARRTMGVRRSVAALAVPQIASPAVFGLRQPRLLLPPGVVSRLTDAELRMVILHEMAHVRRKDTWLNVVLIAVQFLHWFNPLVWLAHRRIRADIELLCDDMVMARLNPEERPGYGRLLLKLIEEISPGEELYSSAVPVVGNKHEIKRRIIMIKNHGQKHRAAPALALLVAVALCCATFTRARSFATPASGPASTPALAGPLIQCDPTPADLGGLKAGEIVNHTYVITNAGSQTLLITNVVPTCGCTVAKDYARAIGPGRTGKILIQFNSAHKSGVVNKKIKVFSNARNQPVQVLSFKASIVASTEKS